MVRESRLAWDNADGPNPFTHIPEVEPVEEFPERDLRDLAAAADTPHTTKPTSEQQPRSA